MYLSSQYSESQAEISSLIPDGERSEVFRLNEQPTYGMYNRNDYMARCYRACWKLNGRQGPELKKLLCFGGKSSTKGDYFSTFFFVLVIFMPLVSFLCFLPERKSFSFDLHFAMSLVVAFVCLIIAVWHSYSLYIIEGNKRKWLSSWFVFLVEDHVMAPPGHAIGSRFFDIRKHMNFYDVTRDSLRFFPLLGKDQKDGLHTAFNENNVDRARIILYTNHFLHSLQKIPRNIVVGLLVFSVFCFGVALYEAIAVSARNHV